MNDINRCSLLLLAEKYPEGKQKNKLKQYLGRNGALKIKENIYTQ